MKRSVSAVLGFVSIAAVNVSPSFGQTPQGEPTRHEIEGSYKSKSGDGGTFIPGVRWERLRIKEIRGWTLHLKRVSEKRNMGIVTLEYRAVARKNGVCAAYQITDTTPLVPNNAQIKPILVVEPGGVKACR